LCQNPRASGGDFHDLQTGSSANRVLQWCAEPNANGVRKSCDKNKDYQSLWAFMRTLLAKVVRPQGFKLSRTEVPV